MGNHISEYLNILQESAMYNSHRVARALKIKKIPKEYEFFLNRYGDFYYGPEIYGTTFDDDFKDTHMSVVRNTLNNRKHLNTPPKYLEIQNHDEYFDALNVEDGKVYEIHFGTWKGTPDTLIANSFTEYLEKKVLPRVNSKYKAHMKEIIRLTRFKTK